VFFSLEFKEVFSCDISGGDLLDRSVLLLDGLVGSSGKISAANKVHFSILLRISLITEIIYFKRIYL